MDLIKCPCHDKKKKIIIYIYIYIRVIKYKINDKTALVTRARKYVLPTTGFLSPILGLFSRLLVRTGVGGIGRRPVTDRTKAP